MKKCFWRVNSLKGEKVNPTPLNYRKVKRKINYYTNDKTANKKANMILN